MMSDRRSEGTRPVSYVIGLLTLVGWFYVFFGSGAFAINEIQVEGLKSLDPIDVSREVYDILDHRPVWKPWSSRHAWFIDRQRLSDELKKRLFAASVVVDKSYAHVLRLKIEERSNKLIFHTHQQYFWTDLQGLVTTELTMDERKQAQARLLGSRTVLLDEPPIIHHDLDELITSGYKVADEHDVKLWIETAAEVAQQGLLFREMEPPTTSSTTAVFTSSDGYPVLVDLSAPLEPQMTTYQLFKKSPPKDLKVSAYVDVRIPGRIYVK